MTLNCEEIYFASNEKSALTGQDGFSVRTYTRGMDTALVSAAASACVKGYEVSPDRQLNLDDLLANPRVVYNFPPSYSFTRYADPSGTVRWVMGRTVYIATDYGFFLDTDGASRVGSNYIAHLLLTSAVPPAGIFSSMADGNLFRPKDYTVRTDNAELRSLLTGEAMLLEPRSVEVADIPGTPDPRMLSVVEALLTAVVNRRKGMEESMGKVIIKAAAADTDGVLRTMSLLPDSMVAEMTFVSNYMQGYGVPTGYDIAIVNEFNTRPIYEENYVVADLIAGKTVNVPSNPIFDAMRQAVAEGRLADFDHLIELFLSVDHAADTDYGFLLTVFRATRTERGLSISDITEPFVTALERSALPADQKAAVRSRMTQTIDTTFLQADRPEAVRSALRAAEIVGRHGGLALSASATRRLTKMMLGVNPYIDVFVTDENVGSVLRLLNKADVASPDEVFTALAKVKSPGVWSEVLRWYFGTSPDDVDGILRRVVDSSPAPATIAAALYPLPDNAAKLYNHLLRVPADTVALRPMVTAMARFASDEFFSGIIANSGNSPTVVDSLDEGVGAYFHRKADADPNSAMKELINFIKKIQPIVYHAFSCSSELIDTYLDHVAAHPGAQEKVIIDMLAPVSEVMSAPVMARYTTLTDLYAGRVPATVTTGTLNTAIAMQLPSATMKGLVEKWISGNVTAAEIKEFARRHRRLAPDVMAAAVMAIWKRFASSPERRAEATLALVDNSDWDKEQRRNFLATCPDKELVAFLGDSDKLLSKLFRRFKNIF